MKPTRIIIAGGREFTPEYIHLIDGTARTGVQCVEDVLFEHAGHLKPEQITVVSGGARGADTIGEMVARAYNMNLLVYPAQWDLYGRSAGHKRNALMADNADMLLAFWDGKSKGTAGMINVAANKGLRVIVTRY